MKNRVFVFIIGLILCVLILLFGWHELHSDGLVRKNYQTKPSNVEQMNLSSISEKNVTYVNEKQTKRDIYGHDDGVVSEKEEIDLESYDITEQTIGGEIVDQLGEHILSGNVQQLYHLMNIVQMEKDGFDYIDEESVARLIERMRVSENDHIWFLHEYALEDDVLLVTFQCLPEKTGVNLGHMYDYDMARKMTYTIFVDSGTGEWSFVPYNIYGNPEFEFGLENRMEISTPVVEKN